MNVNTNMDTNVGTNVNGKIKKNPEESIEGAKISLKRTKPKYSGSKAKIIKNCKNQNITSNIIKKIKEDNEKVEVHEISDDEYVEDSDVEEIEEIKKDIKE